MGQDGDFFALLYGEGQPALEFSIQRVFTTQINRAVQQGARRRYPQTVTQTLVGVLQHGQGFFQVAAPHVATIDQAQRQDLVGWQAIKNGRVLVRCTYQINVQAVDWQVGRQAEVLFQTTEVRGDQFFQGITLDLVIGAFKRVFPFLRQVEHQDRLVDLNPLNALSCQALENLTVQRQQTIQ
ncbi:hypothetical protein D3C78_1123370 [compost metagenome]